MNTTAAKYMTRDQRSAVVDLSGMQTLAQEQQAPAPRGRVASSSFLRWMIIGTVALAVVSIAAPPLAFMAQAQPEQDVLDGQTASAYLLSDVDGDGLLTGEEIELGTSVTSADTDVDGIEDGVEVLIGLNPLDASDAAMDFDHDGLPNSVEAALGTHPYYYTTQID